MIATINPPVDAAVETASVRAEPAAVTGTPASSPGEVPGQCTDSVAFLSLLHPRQPGNVFEIRAPECPVRVGGDFRRTAIGYFSDTEAAGAQLVHLGRHLPAGIYVLPNPVKSDLLARSTNRIKYDTKEATTDDDIVSRHWFVLDCDPSRPSNTSATDSENQAAIRLARSVRDTLAVEGWPAPIFGMSGNGTYLIYRVELPNDNNAKDLIRSVLIGLAKRFDTAEVKIDKSTFNASRGVKVLGTWARKGSHLCGVKDIADRPHRQSWFEPPAGPLEVVSRELLESVASKPEPNVALKSPVPSSRKSSRRSKGKMPPLDRCKACIAGMPDAISGSGGHNATLAAACVCFRLGLSDAEALAVMQEFNATKTGGEPWSERDLEHKLRDAQAKVEAAGEVGSMLRNDDNSRPRKQQSVTAAAGNEPCASGDDADTFSLLDDKARTDVGNARRFTTRHGDKMRWCQPWRKWLAWDGRRWRIDDKLLDYELARDVVQALWQEFVELLPEIDGETENELIRFIRATAKANGLRDMLFLARSEPGIPVLPDAFDSQPWLLNCTNGTIDLKTGRLLPHDQNHFFTKLVPHDFVQSAGEDCPRWLAFLTTIFDGNANMISFVRRLFGSALVGEVIDHVLPILWGKGGNGKSVLIETLFHVFGDDYACKAVSDLLLAKRNESHPTERADLHGKRLVACVETDENRRLDESLVKELTGGDTIKARRMREDFWRFKPSHTAMLVTNHKPNVRGTDEGIWRRLRLVPFAVTIPKSEQDPFLKQKLQAEAAGILAWLVDGCLEWQRDGLGEPEEVVAATEQYRDTMDVLAAFLADCCWIDPAAKAKASELYTAYSKWCQSHGEYAKGNRGFGETMTERGFDRYKNNGTWYRGVGIQDLIWQKET